jgi:methyl-accepting chemotaxis protein
VTAPPTPEPSRPRTISPDVKVLAAVASLIMLLVIAIALAIVFIIALGSAASTAERQGRYTSAVNAAALWAKTLANDERGYFISGDIAFVNQMDGELELARAAFAAAAEAASPEQRATLAEAREGFERWLEAVRSEIAVYQSGDEEAAIATSLGSTRTMRHAYEGWLADASALGVDAFQDATASVADASSRSVLILLVYLVAALALAVAIALWVVRVVLQPAYALVRLLAEAEDDPKPA